MQRLAKKSPIPNEPFERRVSRSNNSFLRNIQNTAQSTPLVCVSLTVYRKVAFINRFTLQRLNGNNSSNTTKTAKKLPRRKRKSKGLEVIDLTPQAKRAKLPTSDSSSDGSDVEIIETINEVIDLVDEETTKNVCTALVTTNVTTDIVTDVDCQTSENNSADAIESSTEHVNLDSGKAESLDETLKNNQNKEISSTTEVSPAPCSSKQATEALYIKDTTGGGAIQPPLYDATLELETISDDSFCSVFTPKILSQRSEVSKDSLIDISDDCVLMSTSTRKSIASTSNSIYDDSVLFVSETIQTPTSRPYRAFNNDFNRPAPDYLAIDNGAGNRKVSFIFFFFKKTRAQF